MHLINILALFFSPLIVGLLVYAFPKRDAFKSFILFVGVYLFTMTILHILPVLYRSLMHMTWVPIFVLVGFFAQLFLEYNTSGIEHGHIHLKEKKDAQFSIIPLLLALSIHAFFEGSILAEGFMNNLPHKGTQLFWGIFLHRMPTALALMVLLLDRNGMQRRSALLPLLIFCAATPLGLLISDYGIGNGILSADMLSIIYALMSGSFLYISTTIVLESNARHQFNIKRLIIMALGVSAFLLVEQLEV